MANFVFNKAATLLSNENDAESLDPINDSIRLMLIGPGYTPDRADDYVGSGAGTPGGEELVATGYVVGHLGAGRHLISNISITEDDTLDLVKIDGDNPADWDPLGGAANDTVTQVILMRDGTTDDSDALLIACFDTLTGGTFPFLTNGGKFTFSFHANGAIRLKTNP